MESAMPEKKSGWTKPGAIDVEEARKGTAAANPVLVVAPDGNLAGAPAEDGRGPRQAEADAVEPRDARSPAEIEADLDRTREHLSETLDELSERLSPRELARRGGRRAKAQFVDEQTGKLRRTRVAAALGGLGTAIGALTALRKVRRRSS
jgi:hypothetical protein